MDLLGAVMQIVVLVMFWGCVLGAVLLFWLFSKLKNRDVNRHGASDGTQPRRRAAEGGRGEESSSPGAKPSTASASNKAEKSVGKERDPSMGATEYYRLDPDKQALYDRIRRESMFGPDNQNPRLDEMLGRKPWRTDDPRLPASTGGSSQDSWEERQRQRANEAESKERVRSALRGLSDRRDPEGWSVYYVFDEIATDSAGIAEQVAVGPWGICIVLVYDLPRGKVTIEQRTDLYRLNGRYFEEDPNERGSALVADIMQRIFGERAPVFYLVCFTSVGEDCVERKDYPGTSCSVWDLATTLVSGGVPTFSHEGVDEIAQKVRETYDREPYVQPNQLITGEEGADLSDEDSEAEPPG